VLADLRDPAAILAHSVLRELIDFTRPVALLLVAILHFIKDEEDPAVIVATLRDSLPAGSYLALSHGTLDFHPPGDAGQAAAGYKNATAPLVLRSREQVSSFFDGC
jgi:S-adenosyl methyltransferase